MAKRKYTTEQIIVKLREIELYCGQGKSPMPSNTTIELDSDTKLALRVSKGSEYIDYKLITKHIWQDFSAFLGKAFYNSVLGSLDGFGFTFPSGSTQSTASAQAVSDTGNTWLKVSSASGSAGQISIRKDNLSEKDTSRKIVFGIDVMVDGYHGQNKVVMYNNGTLSYWNLLYFNADGTMSFDEGGVPLLAKYDINKWYNVIVAMDLDTTDCRVYLNGELKYSGQRSNIKNVGYFKSVIYALATNQLVRNSYVDNIILYPISSVSALSGLDTTISSSLVKIGSDNIITGYGNTTVSNFLQNLITIPNGTSAAVFTQQGAAVDGSTALAEYTAVG